MMNIIDDLAREMQDPQLVVHVSNISSAVEAVIRISIMFIGYDNPKYVASARLHCNCLTIYN